MASSQVDSNPAIETKVDRRDIGQTCRTMHSLVVRFDYSVMDDTEPQIRHAGTYAKIFEYSSR